MNIHGFNIDGDPTGLEYLVNNASALQAAIDIVRAQGSTSFVYKDRHFVLLPASTAERITPSAVP
jgi:hypothetical protein